MSFSILLWFSLVQRYKRWKRLSCNRAGELLSMVFPTRPRNLQKTIGTRRRPSDDWEQSRGKRKKMEQANRRVPSFSLEKAYYFLYPLPPPRRNRFNRLCTRTPQHTIRTGQNSVSLISTDLSMEFPPRLFTCLRQYALLCDYSSLK